MLFEAIVVAEIVFEKDVTRSSTFSPRRVWYTRAPLKYAKEWRASPAEGASGTSVDAYKCGLA